MRIVVDTSTLISAVLWNGLPHRLIELAEAGEVTLCATADTLQEFQGVLSRSKFAKNLITYGAQARRFETKYKQPFPAFRQWVLSSEPLAEVEQDYFDWELAVTGIGDMEREIKRLSMCAFSSPTEAESQTRRRIAEALRSTGLVVELDSALAARYRANATEPRRTPIYVKGKPLSEVIVAER